MIGYNKARFSAKTSNFQNHIILTKNPDSQGSGCYRLSSGYITDLCSGQRGFFVNTYSLDTDLSYGERYPAFEQLGPGLLQK